MAFTYFFRDRQTLEVIVANVLPTLRGYRYVRIWDAGCAHGPEVYSLAMLLRKNVTCFGFRNMSIQATDIDTTGRFGRTITEGVYPERELRRIPPALKEEYFRLDATPGYFRVRDDIRQRVSFTQHDLLSLRPPRSGFRLIVCKNVLLHFSPAQRVEVIRMFHEALADGRFQEYSANVGRPSGRGYAPPRRPANQSTTDSLITTGTKTGKGSGMPPAASNQSKPIVPPLSLSSTSGKHQVQRPFSPRTGFSGGTATSRTQRSLQDS